MRQPVAYDYPSVSSVLYNMAVVSGGDGENIVHHHKFVTPENSERMQLYVEYHKVKGPIDARKGRGAYMRQKSTRDHIAFYDTYLDPKHYERSLFAFSGVIDHHSIDFALINVNPLAKRGENPLTLVVAPAAGYSRQYVENILIYCRNVLNALIAKTNEVGNEYSLSDLLETGGLDAVAESLEVKPVQS